MEKKFRITVDGRVYNVTVEDLSDVGSLPYVPPGRYVPPKPLTPAATPAAPAATRPAGARSTAAPEDVVCPLGGVVDEIQVNVDQSVDQGDRVAVIDAMKMKTSIAAHRSGKITAILVKVGDAVETGESLMKIA
jgi:glutaconyl-CoA/methylmalonyl-CoA decarboxylase subunit gamma